MQRFKKYYLLGFFFIVTVFIFFPHTIEITGVLETWFPYKGLVPYKDFGSFHFPLGRLILLPFHLITNWNLRVDPFLGLATSLLTLRLIYTYSKKFSSRTAVGASIIIFAVFFWYGATAALFFHEMLIGLLLLIASLLIFKTQKNKVISLQIAFLIGFVLSLAEFSGQIATITVATMILLTLILWRIKPNFRKAAFWLVFGFLIPPLALITYFYTTNALYEFYFWNIPYYFTYNGNPKSPFLTLPLIELLAFYIPLLLISIPCLSQFKKIDFETKFLLLSSVSSIPFIFFSIFHPHHFNYILPILSITFAKAIVLLQKSRFKPSLYIGLAVFLLIIITSILPWHWQRFKTPSLEIANGTFPGDHMYETVEWVKKNTPDSAKLMVIGDSLFYLESNRLPSNRASKGLPYNWEPFTVIKPELLSRPADYWVVDQRFVDRLLDYHNRPYMVEFIRDQLDRCYKKVFSEENWEVHRRTC